jgi:hypothetical protein
LNNLITSLLLTTQFEVLASLDGLLETVLTFNTLHSQHNLLRGLGLLSEDRLGLTTETALFAIVTPSALCELGFFTLFVLSDFVRGVATAFARAESFAGFWNVHHFLC